MTNTNGGFFIGKIYGNCEVSSAGGPLNFDLITGSLKATTQGGNIDVGEVKGAVSVKTTSGNIQIRAPHKHVFAETELGEITIKSAKSVEARNIIGGDIKILGLSGYANINSRGNILLIVQENFSGPKLCDLISWEGDITISFAEDFGADIEIRTPITMDLWRETRIESEFTFSDFKQRYQQVEEDQILVISTRINHGGVKINLFVDKGDIFFLKKKVKK